MFQNYSQTYASQLLAAAGLLGMVAHQFGWNWAQSDIMVALSAVANVAGIIWALVHRHSKGNVTPLGTRTA